MRQKIISQGIKKRGKFDNISFIVCSKMMMHPDEKERDLQNRGNSGKRQEPLLERKILERLSSWEKVLLVIHANYTVPRAAAY